MKQFEFNQMVDTARGTASSIQDAIAEEARILKEGGWCFEGSVATFRVPDVGPYLFRWNAGASHGIIRNEATDQRSIVKMIDHFQDLPNLTESERTMWELEHGFEFLTQEQVTEGVRIRKLRG